MKYNVVQKKLRQAELIAYLSYFDYLIIVKMTENTILILSNTEISP